MQFVSGRKQIALMADEKSPARISHRLLAINRSEMRLNMGNEVTKKYLYADKQEQIKRANSSKLRFAIAYIMRNVRGD